MLVGVVLNDPDFTTTRGPRVGTSTGAQVRYTMSADINKHYPTTGEPRTFYNVCRVKSEDEWNFVKSILADVIEGPEIVGPDMDMGAYDFVAGASHLYRRNSLIRFDPQQHPIHEAAFAVDAQVLTGKGWPVRSPTGDLTFRTKPTFPGIAGVGPAERNAPVDGYVDIGVTWKDLPYNVNNFRTDTGDIVDGNFYANLPEQSELCRYCIFKPTVKGSNLQISGANIFFVDDSGAVILDTGGTLPYQVKEPQPFFVPAATFSITIKMVPRVPLGAAMMQSCVNAFNNVPIPANIFPRKPDIGCLLYLGYELSDRYYTCSGMECYDITYAVGYRKGGAGSSFLNRGWNSAYCTKRMDFRRIVAGIYTGGNITRATDGAIIAAAGPDHFTPVTTNATEFGLERITDAGFNTYDFVDMQNIFRFEGAKIF